MGFQSEVRLFCGDNLKILREQIPNDHVQLTVTSPPYDDLRTYNGFSWDFEGLARELYRVTRPGGMVVWVVADRTIDGNETANSFRQALYFRDAIGFKLLDTMIYAAWKMPSGYALRYQNDFEFMFVFSKDKPTTVNILTEPCIQKGKTKGGLFSNKTGKNHSFKPADRPIKEEKKRGNIWKYAIGANAASDKLAFRHPAIFPEKLAQDHILSWSNPGDIVLDPFLGSGTTGKMAVLNDRHFIGCEISKEYFKNAQLRITIAQAERLVSR